MNCLGLAKAEWIFGPLPADSVYNQGINIGPFAQTLSISVRDASTVIHSQAHDTLIHDVEVRHNLLAFEGDTVAPRAGEVIPYPFTGYLFFRHYESNEEEMGRGPLERVDVQNGTTVAANYSVHYKVDSGTIGTNPWQAPQDGDSVDVWMANEADARTEAGWRPGCESGETVRVWFEGRQEVWGRTYPGT